MGTLKHLCVAALTRAAVCKITANDDFDTEPEVFKIFEYLDRHNVPVLHYGLAVLTEDDEYNAAVLLRSLIYYWRNFFIPGIWPKTGETSTLPDKENAHRIILFVIPEMLDEPFNICTFNWRVEKKPASERKPKICITFSE